MTERGQNLGPHFDEETLMKFNTPSVLDPSKKEEYINDLVALDIIDDPDGVGTIDLDVAYSIHVD